MPRPPRATLAACRILGPAGVLCQLRLGHEGDHRRAMLRWTTPAAAGWPRSLPCLRCGKRRTASWAGDRLHAECGMAE